MDAPATAGMEPLLAVAAEEAKKYGESIRSLSCPGNTRRLARIRGLVALALQQRCSASLHEIGDLFLRHHTSILLCTRKAKSSVATPPAIPSEHPDWRV